jgi:hypothetical protein
MSHWFLLYVLIVSFMWAKMEIEIEGRDGWAANLPTWRIKKHILLDIFMGGRPLTGYHAWAFTFIFTSFHLPFFWAGGWTWSWRAECHVEAATLIFWVVEDFLWFVLNPHFGWSKYHGKEIWWHKHWFMGLPVDYWVMSCMGLLLFLVPLR